MTTRLTLTALYRMGYRRRVDGLRIKRLKHGNLLVRPGAM